MKSEWRIMRAEEFIDFNPRLSIKKGEIATKISMDKLQPFTKQIPETGKASFTGGAKFCNGDTIMARITPCLENGKTAFVDILADGEVAFGSTEFIVMRAKKGISDPQFVYYLATSPDFRQVAIQSMVGSSGRQRVQQDVLNNVEIAVPTLEEQKKIGTFLKKFDDKIALNNKINDNLEQQTQALYQKYFPETDNAGKLADLCDFSKDKIAVSELNVKNYFSTENMLPDKKGTTEAANLPAVEQTTACHIGNVLVSNIRPYFKKILYCHCEGGCSTDVLCFVPKILELSAYLYCTLYADKFFDFMVAGSKGTKMPRGDKKQIMTYSVCLPSENELKNFNAAVLPMFQLIESNRRENARLSLLRDTLLPKLMAGEI